MPPAQPVAQPVPPVPQPARPVAQPGPPVPPPQPQPVQPGQQQVPPQWQAQPQPRAPQRSEPNWEALADRNEADGKRRRRLRVLGVAVAVVVVGGLVAGGAMLMTKKDGGGKPVAGQTGTASSRPSSAAPSAAGAPSGTLSGAPSGTPGGAPDDPSKPIWEAATDPAPQDAGALFSALQVTVNGATWNRTFVSLDSPCWDGNSTTGGLGKVLGDQGCQKVLRATYVSGDSAVTVGVAVFDHKIQAETSMKSYTGHLKGAVAPGAPAFCATPGCTNTHNTLGRYAYFTVEGSAKGGDTADAAATAAAAGFGEHVKGQLLQRAKAASAAAPGAQGATPAG
ncbi:hypothetical protein ACIPLC_06695 [Kitasatospora sp. NPDC086801]|uniref:hypothetical protein n=1 Tax=Kitasatospora sp. NPDC086801 TaxID=3364066 RepID=UPI00382B1ECD